MENNKYDLNLCNDIINNLCEGAYETAKSKGWPSPKKAEIFVIFSSF